MVELITESIQRTMLNLNKTKEEGKQFSNSADNFLPIATNKKDEGTGSFIDWNTIYRELAERLFMKKSHLQTIAELKAHVENELSEYRKTRDIVPVISKVYLENEGFRNITPLAYLMLDTSEKHKGKTAVFRRQFNAMLSTGVIDADNQKSHNQLEELLVKCIDRGCEADSNISCSSVAYLPFLAETFTKDLQCLAKNDEWFIRDFEAVVKLYAFLYLTQLTLNLEDRNIFNEPKSQKLYFMLDIERASKDRYECKNRGYDSLFGEAGAARKLFPKLTYLNFLTNAYGESPIPYWLLVKEVEQLDDKDDIVAVIKELNSLLAEVFGEVARDKAMDLTKQISSGIDVQLGLFSKSSKSSTRADANKKVFEYFKDKYCSEFRKAGGPAGNFLQLTTHHIILLTNLIIGPNNKMLISDVIAAFEARGIWLDIKSKQVLKEVYIKIGNVEKLSDSGEAVYVKSTI